MSEVTILNS